MLGVPSPFWAPYIPNPAWHPPGITYSSLLDGHFDLEESYLFLFSTLSSLPYIESNDNDDLDKSKSKEKINKKESERARERENKKEISESFNKLWELYPKQEGRKAALEAYTKAINNGAEPEVIEKGIKRYLKHIQKTNKEPRYIKLLATYFEGEHWNDVYNDTGAEPGEKAPPAGKDPNRGYYNKKGEWVTTSYDLAEFERLAVPFR